MFGARSFLNDNLAGLARDRANPADPIFAAYSTLASFVSNCSDSLLTGVNSNICYTV